MVVLHADGLGDEYQVGIVGSEAGQWVYFQNVDAAFGVHAQIHAGHVAAETAEAQRDEPALVARLVMRELDGAMADLRSLLEELGEDPDAVLEDLLVEGGSDE